MRSSLVLILGLCLAPVLLAQESDRPQPQVSPSLEAPQLRFDHLTVQDGLAEGTVSGLYQDRQGFIWIANQSALQRCDRCEPVASVCRQGCRRVLESCEKEQVVDVSVSQDFTQKRSMARIKWRKT